jgi:predicted O-methyltransferase YrrM
VASPEHTVCSLERPEVRAVLDRLHGAARGDLRRFPLLLPRVVVGFLRGKTFAEAVTPAAMRDFYIAVPRGEGEFLYLTARAIAARRVVEFGSSFGISTLYLAAAVRDNGGGVVIGSELEANKQEATVAETLREVPEPVDMVFLDGWKDLYLPVLELLKPRLRVGAVVLADNIHTFRKSLRPYVERMQSPGGGFVSSTLSISDGVEYSVYEG